MCVLAGVAATRSSASTVRASLGETLPHVPLNATICSRVKLTTTRTGSTAFNQSKIAAITVVVSRGLLFRVATVAGSSTGTSERARRRWHFFAT